MPARLTGVDPAQATGKAKDPLDAVRAKLDLTPNMTRTMAKSPAVLEGYLGLNVALNLFINDFNHVAATQVDFPKVELLAGA